MKFRRLIFANLFRKKIRLTLTIGSFAIALLLFTFLAVVKSAFSRGIEIAGADRLVIVNRIGLMGVMPISYADKVRAIPGVKYVTHDHWFGGVYQDEKNFFPQFVIDPENHRQVYPEFKVPDEQWKNFLNDRQGAIAGARTAERFHWKVGDRIPIKAALWGGATWEFNLDGIYHTENAGGDESQFWLQWKYFDESLPDPIKAGMKSTAGWYILKLESPDDAVRVAKAIDEKFANSSAETKTETESAFAAGFAKQFGNIEFLIVSIGSVVFFTLLLVTGNTMAISVRERISELAILKAVGFTDRSVLFLVLSESVAIALAGGVLGLLLALLLIPGISVAMAGLLPPLLLSKPMLVLGVGFAVFVGAISGLLPGIGAMRMRVVNALRRV
ncbi:MAG TPA: ABC transporter permease [Candidatus Dormibacteraeota bacterium]|nr:ABC transporter permease [Candidatus Dormibacteraeota bacterium]